MFNREALLEALELGGRFQVEHIRDGEVIAVYDFHNEITTEGKNALLTLCSTTTRRLRLGTWVS